MLNNRNCSSPCCVFCCDLFAHTFIVWPWCASAGAGQSSRILFFHRKKSPKPSQELGVSFERKAVSSELNRTTKSQKGISLLFGITSSVDSHPRTLQRLPRLRAAFPRMGQLNVPLPPHQRRAVGQ